MKSKKFIIIGIILIVILSIGSFWLIKTNQKYTYEWVEVKTSSVGQYKLYVNNSWGKHIDGTVRLVFINGKSKKVEVDKEGLLYPKSIVSEVRNPNKR